MKRIVDVDMETKCAKAKTAVERFMKKYPQCDEEGWRELFDYMIENNIEHFADEYLANGERNDEWCYSLWLIDNEDSYYIAVILREED